MESALGNLGESSKIIKDEIKKSIDSLNKIREQMLKCEDTSGSDEELYDQSSTVHQLQTKLNEFEDKMGSLQEKIKVIQEVNMH